MLGFSRVTNIYIKIAKFKGNKNKDMEMQISFFYFACYSERKIPILSKNVMQLIQYKINNSLDVSGVPVFCWCNN
jgi:hypothetical protein